METLKWFNTIFIKYHFIKEHRLKIDNTVFVQQLFALWCKNNLEPNKN